MVYFDLFYKKICNVFRFLLHFIYGTKLSERRDESMRQNRSGYLNKYTIYTSRQSIRPQCISCCAGFLYCIITGAVTKLPKKVIPKIISACRLPILHHNRRGYQAPKESDPKKNFCRPST
jgi:hypothetical protein